MKLKFKKRYHMLKIKLMSSFLKKSKDLVKKLEEEIIDHKILEMKIKRMKVSKAKMKEAIFEKHCFSIQ